MVRVKQKRLRDAREDFLRAALLAPTRIDSWCALAEACLELNSFTEATWALGKCVSLDPQMQSAHGTRARLLVVKARKRLAQRM
jgi:cytochrome c-type biogenesis protein CcmH/NrfG